MPTRRIYIFLVILAALFTAPFAAAQEGEEDFRRFKFYDDEEWWWEPVADSVVRPQITAMDIAAIARSARYQLSEVSHNRFGDGFDEEHRLARIGIDYSSAALLRSLGYYEGIDGHKRHIEIGRERALRREGQYLRLNLAGRGLWGGLTHRGIYRPTPNGIRLKDEGWQIVQYARVRTGRDIYVEGIAGNAVDIALNLVRRTRRDNLSIIALLPWSERGLRSATTDEAIALSGNKRYNPAWGIQSGEQRSSRVTTALHPELFVNYSRRLSIATTLALNADIGFKRSGRTALAWFNTITPMPDNYRYLPSFASDDESRREITDAWQRGDRRYTQIDWDRLFRANIVQSDGHAVYAVESRRSNLAHAALSAEFESRIGRVDLSYGVCLDYESDRRFKEMRDLLGATHIVDLDYFLEDDDTYCNMLQNNLREPNRRIEEGDRFGYDFNIARRRVEGFVALGWRRDKMAFGVEGGVAGEALWRRGRYEKEIFPGAGSFGRSRKLSFAPYRLRADWSYETLSHTLALSLSLRGVSPEANDLFLQTNYNNRVVESPELSHQLFATVAYGYASPKLRLGVTAFLSSATRLMSVVRYFDDLTRTYADAVVRGVGYLNFGVAVDAEVAWSTYFSSLFSLTAGSYRHSRNPEVEVFSDIDNRLIARGQSAMRGVRGKTPQLTAYGDIEFSRGGWSAKLGVKYWGFRYIEASPIRRMVRFAQLDISPEEREQLLGQERLPDALSADISLSKNLYLGENMLIVEVAVRNLLGTDYVINGYEQHRVRRQDFGKRSYICPFDNLKLYGYPRNYAVNVTLLF